MSTYLIIGASSGIGRETATQLGAEGHTVIATYNTHLPAAASPAIQYHHCNVLDDQALISFIPETLDGLVYCPGSINLRPFARIKPEDFVSDYQLQVAGAVKLVQAALPALKKSGQGSIVLFSTVAVQVGLPFHAQVAASKGAVEGLTRALAAEFAPSIRVNCIAPSLTDTPLAAGLLNTPEKREASAQRHPLKKTGTTTDIANMVSFLLSSKAGWITGQVFHVDGGMAGIK